MNEYIFKVFDADDNELGTVEMIDHSLPSHLLICLNIIQNYPEAKSYAFKGCLDKYPVSFGQYLPNEFYQFLEKVNGKWRGAVVVDTRTTPVGKENEVWYQGKIIGLQYDREGFFFFIEWYATGAITSVNMTDIIHIKPV